MSPSETTQQPDLLEHPAEGVSYFRYRGDTASAWLSARKSTWGHAPLLVVCRDEEVARTPFWRRLKMKAAASCIPAPGGASLTTPVLETDLSIADANSGTALDAPWTCGRSSTPILAVPRLRVDAVVGQGPGFVAFANTPPLALAVGQHCHKPSLRWRCASQRLSAQANGHATLRRDTDDVSSSGRERIGQCPTVAAYRPLLLAGQRAWAI